MSAKCLAMRLNELFANPTGLPSVYQHFWSSPAAQPNNCSMHGRFDLPQILVFVLLSVTAICRWQLYIFSSAKTTKEIAGLHQSCWDDYQKKKKTANWISYHMHQKRFFWLLIFLKAFIWYLILALTFKKNRRCMLPLANVFIQKKN